MGTHELDGGLNGAVQRLGHWLSKFPIATLCAAAAATSHSICEHATQFGLGTSMRAVIVVLGAIGSWLVAVGRIVGAAQSGIGLQPGPHQEFAVVLAFRGRQIATGEWRSY